MKKTVITFLAFMAAGSVLFAQGEMKEPAKKMEKSKETVSAPVEKLQSVNLSIIEEFNKEKLLNKKPFETDKLVFNSYFLSPRQILAFHKHPKSDEIFYVAEGEGQFTVGKEQVMVSSGSTVYGPANIDHGVINSGNTNMVVISVQAPKPVDTEFAKNSSVKCPVCGQENILKSDVKEGDIIVCPRCHSRLRVSKDKDGNWIATQME